ncbi:hypothetical protein PFLUV_G00038370 [Perca fluviatilis]|uniref:Reverse transcriptase domain-containing protein n=1 Tax=Perca fluviatilis TaxID=8168 RepID=A0A6A5EP90_PERFL|nr:hypothetical protein PFLUV_G00038370 [Perca fluviatilis]
MKLEASISSIEEVLNRDSDPSLGQVLKKKQLELSSFLNERVKGALIRCRFLQLKDMDAPSSFFFNLERSVAQRKQMTCLQLPGGRVTTSPGEMRSHAMVFYADLFGAQQCSMQSREELLEGLPQLSLDEKAALDCELTLEELKAAVNQMATGKAPGIDGLSTDFYKHFWNTIGPDLHELVGHSPTAAEGSAAVWDTISSLFLYRTEDVDLNGLTSFYDSVLQAWQKKRKQASRDADSLSLCSLDINEPSTKRSKLVSRVSSLAGLLQPVKTAPLKRIGQTLQVNLHCHVSTSQ